MITQAMTRDEAATARLKINIGSTSFSSNACTVSELEALTQSQNYVVSCSEGTMNTMPPQIKQKLVSNSVTGRVGR